MALKSPEADKKHFVDVLENILVPRVAGTPSHSKVKEYIKAQLQSLGWAVTSDIFTARTPVLGDICFENIIAKLNSEASKVVVLSCHYDSKFFPDFEFVGATDAGVPCAMLVHLAYSLHKKLEPLKKKDTSIEIWFFDGEEAFGQWGPTDSLYGAKHLAEKLDSEKYLPKIKCLILLDLLGTKNPSIYNYYNENEIFHHLVEAETVLRSKGALKGPNCHTTYFKDKRFQHYVEDDHTPFMQRGVPIVHIIPSHFPSVWHTSEDNIDAIDISTVDDLIQILRLFIIQYFNI